MSAKVKMSKEQKQGVDDVFNSLDYVLETHYAPDFVEIVGSTGGDVLVRRVYKDGSVYCR